MVASAPSILVVDDSGHIQKHFRPYLEEHFKEIHFVQGDTEAGTLPNGNAPDVMIINCNRPLEMYEKLIQNSNHTVPIITLVDPAQRRGGDETTAHEEHPRITGPVNPEELVELLDALRYYRYNMEFGMETEEEPPFDSPYRKTIESALHESEANYKEIFNATSEGFLIYDARNGKILDINQAAESMFGYPKKELLKLDIDRISSGISPYTLSEARIQMRKALRNGQCLFEWHARKKDGTLFWIEITLKRALLEGHERIIAVTRNITERKVAHMKLEESEKKLRTIFEYAGDGILTVDIQNRHFLFANKKMCEMLGYSEEELLDRSIEDIHPEEELPHLLEMFQGRAEGRYAGSYEMPMQRKDGSLLYVEGSASLVDSVDTPYLIGVFKDVTKTRRLLNELNESKKALSKAKEIARMGAFEHDITTNIQSYSKPLCAILGLPLSRRKMPLGEFISMLHPDDAAELRAAQREIFAHQRKGASNEVRFIRPDGTLLHLLISVNIKYDDKDRPVVVRGLMQDITERRELEKELRQSEREFRSIVEMTNTVPWRFDLRKNRYTYIGPQVKRLWGYDQAEWAGADLERWYRRIHPDDRDGARDFCMQETEAGRDHILEFRGVRPDGEIVWIKESVSVITEGGKPTELIGYMFDINEQKKFELALLESEELFRTLSENILTGILLFSTDRIIYINPAAQEILGFGQAALKRQFVEKRLTPELQSILSDEKAVLSGDENLTMFYKEVEIMAKGDDQRWIQIETTATNYKGESVRMLVFTDITEEKINRDRLDETTQKLQQFNNDLERRVRKEVEKNRNKEQMMLQQSRFAQMGEMLGMIAHQWRQPLNAISATAINIRLDNRLGDLDSQAVEKHAAFIETQTGMMSETINDFMNLFKPVKEKQDVRITEVVDAVNKIIGAQMRNRDITIITEIPDTLSVKGTFNELEHVILNLVANARDAFDETQKDKKMIIIKGGQKGNRTVITVSDNAGGIRPEIMDRIFDAYFTTKLDEKGTGIGLYMTKTIIERNFDGKIDVANTGDGTCFTISIKGSV